MRTKVLAGAVLSLVAALVVTPSSAAAATSWWTGQETVDEIKVDAQLGRILLAGDGLLVQISSTTGAELERTDIGAGAAQLAVSPDGQTAYTFVDQDSTIHVVDLTSGTIENTIAVPSGWVGDLTPSAGRLYYVGQRAGLSCACWVDPADAGDVIHEAVLTGPGGPIRGLLATEDASRVFTLSTDSVVNAYDSSGTGLTLAGTRVSDKSYQFLTLDADGQHLVATVGAYQAQVLRRSDLVVDKHLTFDGTFYGRLLSSPGGGFLVDSGQPCGDYPIFARTGALRRVSSTNVTESDCHRGPVAWLDRALVMTAPKVGGGRDVVLDERATSFRTTMTLDPRVALHADTDTVHGTITSPWVHNAAAVMPPPAGITVHVRRTVNGVETDLPDMVTRADGSFGVRDHSGAHLGDTVSYAFTFVGSEDYDTAGASSAVMSIAGAPWDFNSDGYADLAVSAPGKQVAGHRGAGSVTVVPGGPSGPTGTGATTWTQDSPGVPGGAESGDSFGWALTSGDYDGDGYADLAVSAPAEDIGDKTDVGWVTVIRGSATGLSGAYSPTAAITAKSKKYAGDSLATLDVDADGRDDLAMGMTGVRRAVIYEGTSTGATRLTPAFSKSDAGGDERASTLFGVAMAAGDLDGDGYGDLAVGAPYDYEARGYSVGAVVVAYGSTGGLNRQRAKTFTPDSSGVLGTSHVFGTKDSPDSFGRLLAAGDLNGDGFDDLAIGAPGVPVATAGVKHEDAGEVHELLGSANGLTSHGNVLLTMDSSGVPGKATTSAGFGRSLAIGHDRDSAKATLAASNFLQTVILLPGGTATGAVAVTQESPGVPGGTEEEDDFGSFLRFSSWFGDGRQELAVSADGENKGGSVDVLPTTSKGISPLVGTLLLTQESPGIPGSSAAQDRWGWLSDSH